MPARDEIRDLLNDRMAKQFKKETPASALSTPAPRPDELIGLRKRIHVLENHNQYFERCESAWCHPTERDNPALGIMLGMNVGQQGEPAATPPTEAPRPSVAVESNLRPAEQWERPTLRQFAKRVGEFLSRQFGETFEGDRPDLDQLFIEVDCIMADTSEESAASSRTSVPSPLEDVRGYFQEVEERLLSGELSETWPEIRSWLLRRLNK